jgi:hypothetical protein
MLRDPQWISKEKALKDKKEPLIKEKIELVQSIKELNISGQAASKYEAGLMNRQGVDHQKFELRKIYAKRITEIEKELLAISSEQRSVQKTRELSVESKLLEVFREIFTTDQMREITNEAVRRAKGEHPFRISFSVQEAIQSSTKAQKYRVIAKEQLEKMIEFRLLLTRLIEEGCAKFGDAEFLKFISPLNRLIIPLKELEKIKRQNLL